MPGTRYSKLDALAESSGATIIDQFFRDHSSLRRLAMTLSCILKDEERGDLALRKNIHWMVEARLRTLALRADPPTEHGPLSLWVPRGDHPIDPYIIGALGLTCSQISFRYKLMHFIEVFTIAFALSIRTLWVGVTDCRKYAGRQKCKIIAANAGTEERWLALLDALSNHGFAPSKEFLAEIDHTTEKNFQTLKVIDRRNYHISLRSWLHFLLPASTRIVFSALKSVVISPHKPLVREAAIQLMRAGNRLIEVARFLDSVEFSVYIDNQEYDTRHILIAALKPLGARVVRLPHSDMDTPGVGLSYLGYDQFFASGNYQSEAYDHTWGRSVMSIATGPLQYDSRYRTFTNKKNKYSDFIETAVQRQDCIVVVFGPSDSKRSWTLLCDQLSCLIDPLERAKQWTVIVKPKPGTPLSRELKKDPRLSGWLTDQRVICLEYPSNSNEIYSSTYLMEIMSFGLTLPGSVQTEALSRGRPVVAYSPVIAETPLNRHLKDLGLLHHKLDDLSGKFEQLIHNTQSRFVDYSWFRTAFDPFGDDQALKRLANDLLN